MSVDPGAVRDLIEAGLSEPADAGYRYGVTPGEAFVINSNADSLQDDYLQDITQLARLNAVDRITAASQAAVRQPAPPIQTNPSGPEVPGELPTPSSDAGADTNQQ